MRRKAKEVTLNSLTLDFHDPSQRRHDQHAPPSTASPSPDETAPRVARGSAGYRVAAGRLTSRIRPAVGLDVAEAGVARESALSSSSKVSAARGHGSSPCREAAGPPRLRPMR